MDAERSDAQALNQEARDIWNQNAAWWDERIGAEGNCFHQTLIGPATERLLDVQPGEVVVDVGCGNGAFARRLAELGAQVVACDFSQAFLEHARARTTEHADRIEYRLVDATDEAQLLALGERRFDAAVCVMALMDMATIHPLMWALSRILKHGGRLVFAVLHPCFNSSGCRMVVEQEDRGGELVTTYAVKVLQYHHLPPKKGVGIVGQPAAHYYFDRPLSVLLRSGFDVGFVLDGLEEPCFDEEAREDWPFSWANYKDIPPALVARMRLV